MKVGSGAGVFRGSDPISNSFNGRIRILFISEMGSEKPDPQPGIGQIKPIPQAETDPRI